MSAASRRENCKIYLATSRLHEVWLYYFLNHWGRVTHICVSNLTTIGSDNGLSLGRRQVITWTNAGLLLIGPLGRNFSEILFGIQTFSFKKKHMDALFFCDHTVVCGASMRSSMPCRHHAVSFLTNPHVNHPIARRENEISCHIGPSKDDTWIYSPTIFVNVSSL